VSHVVTTGLSGSKTEQFEDRTQHGKRIHVVHPDWIIECCRQKRRLPESDFTILERKNNITAYMEKQPKPNQTRTHAFTSLEEPTERDMKCPRPHVGLSTLFQTPASVDSTKRPRDIATHSMHDDTHFKQRKIEHNQHPSHTMVSPKTPTVLSPRLNKFPDPPVTHPIVNRPPVSVGKTPKQHQPSLQLDNFPKAQRRPTDRTGVVHSSNSTI